MLLMDSMEDMVLMERERMPDGEGGWTVSGWTETVPFRAAITYDSSMEARTAEAQGVTSLYTVTAPKGATLEYHDVFKRKRDGKVFRVTSDGDDKHTPDMASFQVLQVTAEEWELTS